MQLIQFFSFLLSWILDFTALHFFILCVQNVVCMLFDMFCVYVFSEMSESKISGDTVNPSHRSASPEPSSTGCPPPCNAFYGRCDGISASCWACQEAAASPCPPWPDGTDRSRPPPPCCPDVKIISFFQFYIMHEAVGVSTRRNVKCAETPELTRPKNL